MTEADWNNADDPQRMLAFLRDSGKQSDRKARLFAVAVCRRIWPVLRDERSRKAVEVAEAYADGLAGEQELEQAEYDAVGATGDGQMFGRPSYFRVAAVAAACTASTDALDPPAISAPVSTALDVAESAAEAATTAGSRYTADPYLWVAFEAGNVQPASQATLLRDLFNPFYVGPFNLAWRTPTIVALATTNYEDRSFDRLPILADALEEVGCTDAELLGHLRGPGPFVRGDWALDVALGRE